MGEGISNNVIILAFDGADVCGELPDVRELIGLPGVVWLCYLAHSGHKGIVVSVEAELLILQVPFRCHHVRSMPASVLRTYGGFAPSILASRCTNY